MLEFVIATQAVVILGLAVILASTHARLFRAAMSRTPGEYRKAEADKKPQPRPAPASKGLVDEATAMVLAAVSSDEGYPMPSWIGEGRDEA